MKAKAMIAALVAAAAGCTQSGLDDQVAPVELDESFYRCNVQPVLSARCAFVACHGTDDRPLRIYAEQKLRLGIDWVDYETPLTADERAANLKALRDFAARGPGDADLLAEKPLDVAAGGLFHRGRDLFGAEDVFVSRDDPGYQILRRFIDGAVEDPGCNPTEEVGP